MFRLEDTDGSTPLNKNNTVSLMFQRVCKKKMFGGRVSAHKGYWENESKGFFRSKLSL
jgi:hypothetical protein